MKFLFPTFLFALFAVAIPVIIHLFSFKQHKTVYFSNVNFLKEIKKESKKRSQLKQILLLIARIFTIVFLVFAFAQPYIPTNQNNKKQATQIVAIYIDNSFSMNALSEQGQLLEVARNKAVEICQAYPAGTKFRLFTNDMEPKTQYDLNREQFIREVSNVHSSPVVVPLSLVYNKFSQQTANAKNSDKNLYFISDFQRSVTDPENFSDKSIYSFYIPLTPNNVANLYIDSCWVEVPAHRLNQEEELFVRIKNSSTEDYNNLPLKLYLNDSIKSITNFSVKAENEIVAKLKYINNTSGIQLGRTEITDYPFTHDNNWYISYYVEPKLKALAIFNNTTDSNEGLKYISALFENDDYIQLDKMNINALQISKLNNYNTIFLLNPESFSSGFLSALQNSVASGVSVVLFPSIKNNPLFNNSFLELFGANRVAGIDTTNQKISGIDFENRFYKNVFRKKEKNAIMPNIKGHLQFNQNIRSSESRLLWFQNNDKALSTLTYKRGKVWVFSFPLSANNEPFARDVLFVPTIYNIVLNSLPAQKISFTVGKTTSFTIRNNKNIDLSQPIKIEDSKNNKTFIPSKSSSSRGVRVDFAGQIKNAGHYFVKNGNKTVATMAFNFDRKESDLHYISAAELESKLSLLQLKNASVIRNVTNSFSEIFDELQNGKQLWKLFILLALAAILGEVLIARFLK